MSDQPRATLAYARPADPVKEIGPGVAASLLLHLTALLIVLYLIMRAAEQPAVPLHVVPIDLVVRLGETTTSPQSAQTAPMPVSRAIRSEKREELNPRPFEGTAPNKVKEQPLDDLDAKLRALSRLRTPEQKLPALDNTGTSDATASNGAVSGEAIYSLRDYVRAQVERRWNLDLGKLGGRHFVVPLRIVMRKDGRIEKVEIVERERMTTDAAYKWIALSARNAVLLSSPVALPPGDYDEEMNFTLDLNPRDVLR